MRNTANPFPFLRIAMFAQATLSWISRVIIGNNWIVFSLQPILWGRKGSPVHSPHYLSTCWYIPASSILIVLCFSYSLKHWICQYLPGKITCVIQISDQNVCITPSVCSSIFQPELLNWLLKVNARSTTVVTLGMLACVPLSCQGELQCQSHSAAQVSPARCKVRADAGGIMQPPLFPFWLQTIMWCLFVLPSALLSL